MSLDEKSGEGGSGHTPTTSTWSKYAGAGARGIKLSNIQRRLTGAHSKSLAAALRLYL